MITEIARPERGPTTPLAGTGQQRSVRLRLAAMLAVDAVFALGVLLPHLRGGTALDPGEPAALGLLSYVSVFLAPVVAYLVGAGSLTRLVRLRGGDVRRRAEPAVLAAAVLGLAMYVSPWGIAAVRALLAD